MNVAVSLFVARAPFGDVGVSLFHFSWHAPHLNTCHRIALHLTTCHYIAFLAVFCITTTDAPRQHNQPPSKRHHQTEQPMHAKTSVWASHWLVTLCAFYKHSLKFLWLIIFFPCEASAPGLPGSTCRGGFIKKGPKLTHVLRILPACHRRILKWNLNSMDAEIVSGESRN